MIVFENQPLEFSGFEEQLLRKMAQKHGVSIDRYIYDCIRTMEEEEFEATADAYTTVIMHWRRIYPALEIAEVMEDLAISCEAISEKSMDVPIDRVLKFQGVTSWQGHCEAPIAPRVYCGPGSSLYILVEGAPDEPPRVVRLDQGETSTPAWQWELGARRYRIAEEELKTRDDHPFERIHSHMYYTKRYDSSMEFETDNKPQEEADDVIDRFYPDGMK